MQNHSQSGRLAHNLPPDVALEHGSRIDDSMGGRHQCWSSAAHPGRVRRRHDDGMQEDHRSMHRVGLALAGSVCVAALAARYRTWHLTWGATYDEATGRMPGDDLIGSAGFVATRAISIAAPPDSVWPWLVQVGVGRAGFYSYDWIDNLGHDSAQKVLPQFQRPSVGDLAAPMTSKTNDGSAFRVASVDEPRALVWSKPGSTWAWRLTRDETGGTRLVTRLKARYELGPFLPVTVMLMEIGDFPMMRRMLLGIAERATRAA